MRGMMDLKAWLREQGLSVQELALELDVPLKTAQDWVYRGATPLTSNRRKLDEFMACTHHWVIDRPDGPVSRGVCKLCQEVREFENTISGRKWGNQPVDTPRSGDERAAK